jgi:hypothetical protein
VNTTLTINGKVYRLHQRLHTESIEPLRTHTKGLTGKSVVVDFGADDVALDVEILCYLDGKAPFANFGTVSDLKTAWATAPVTVVDLDGTSASYVPAGKLDLSRQFSIVDEAAPFVVRCRFEEYES